jgi:hypothetical protein
MKFQKISMIGLAVMLNFATVGMGKYIDGENGKLAVSNLTPLVFLLLAIPSYGVLFNRVNRQVIGFLLMFNLFAWISFLLFMFRYGWQPNIPVMAFQEIEFIFAVLLVCYANRNSDEFRVVARIGLLISGVISGLYGLQELLSGESIVVVTFGMDDKSQAAVLFCCQAYILIRYFGGLLDSLVAAALLLLSLVTLSRLPFIFVPVLFLAMAVRSKFAAGVAIFALVAGVVAVVSLGDAITQIFRVLDRLSSVGAVASDDATSAHLILIKTALEMKFTDGMTFVFGIGPGNFAKALTDFPLPFTALKSADPTLVDAARIGRAPVHSTPLSALLDYNILLFGLLLAMMMRAINHMMVRRQHVELLFFTTLFAASMFYSIHNKHYLFVVCATIYILAERGGKEAGSVVAQRVIPAVRPASLASPGY